MIKFMQSQSFVDDELEDHSLDNITEVAVELLHNIYERRQSMSDDEREIRIYHASSDPSRMTAQSLAKRILDIDPKYNSSIIVEEHPEINSPDELSDFLYETRIQDRHVDRHIERSENAEDAVVEPRSQFIFISDSSDVVKNEYNLLNKRSSKETAYRERIQLEDALAKQNRLEIYLEKYAPIVKERFSTKISEIDTKYQKERSDLENELQNVHELYKISFFQKIILTSPVLLMSVATLQILRAHFTNPDLYLPKLIDTNMFLPAAIIATLPASLVLINMMCQELEEEKHREILAKQLNHLSEERLLEKNTLERIQKDVEDSCMNSVNTEWPKILENTELFNEQVDTTLRNSLSSMKSYHLYEIENIRNPPQCSYDNRVSRPAH